MAGQKLPPDVWASTIRGVIAYRGPASPEKLAEQFHPPRLSGQDIRRIVNGKDNTLGTDRGDQKLAVLAGMLALPVEALRLLYYGDRAQLEALDFGAVENGAAVKQFLLQQFPTGRNRSSA